MLDNDFQMTRLGKFQAAALAGALCLACASSLAGDAIIVPGDKSKTPRPNEAPAPKEVFKLRDTIDATPFDVLMVPVLPEKQKRLDPKEEKRRRLQELEKKNWMVVDQGELQAEEDAKNFLNVRDHSLDAIEKRDDTGNLMFRPIGKDDRRIPGQFRSPNEKPVRPATQEGDESSAFNRPEKDPQLGSHMSSELNLRNLFDTRQTGGSDSLSPKFNKSELTLHSLLNSGAEVSRDQQTRREEFRNFLNKPSNPLAGPSDPINSRDLVGRQPLNPTAPSSFNPFSPPRASAALSATAPAFSPARPGFSAGSYLTPAESPRAKAPLAIDPPRRKF